LQHSRDDWEETTGVSPSTRGIHLDTGDYGSRKAAANNKEHRYSTKARAPTCSDARIEEGDAVCEWLDLGCFLPHQLELRRFKQVGKLQHRADRCMLLLS